MGLRIISLFVGVAALAVYVAIQAGALAAGTVLRALGYVLIGLIFLVGIAICLLIMVAIFGGSRKGNGQQKDTSNPSTEPRANKIELPPIIAVRRPRKPGFRDDARSWIGRLPTLGGIPWPRTSDGAAMHFAAQLDLAELSKVGAGAILPTSGSLAFFVGLESRVIYTPVGSDAPTPPPDDLDVIGNVIGHGALTRGIAPDESGNVLPHWPVEFVMLDVEAPESLASVNAAIEAHFDLLKSAVVSHKALVKERGPEGLYFQDSAWRFAQSLRNCLAAANGSDHARSFTEEVEQ